MKKTLIHIGMVLGMWLLTYRTNAQQVYQFSQYLQNLYIINSATAGLHDYTELNLSYRTQWVGINNAPQTMYASLTQPLGKRLDLNPKKSSVRISSPTTYNNYRRTSYHAVGGYIARDSYGPYSMNAINFSYTFHLPIAEEMSLSFSPNVGITQVSFNQNKAQVELENDPTYSTYLGVVGNNTRGDLNLAFWLSHPKFFAGYSSKQLLGDRLKFKDQIQFLEVKAHHNVIAGYHFELTKKLKLTPSIMAKYVNGFPFTIDLNAMVDYNEILWGGISYRNAQSLVGMAGVNLNSTFRIGYSFDLTLTSLQLQNAGSHEITLGINLFNKEKAIF